MVTHWKDIKTAPLNRWILLYSSKRQTKHGFPYNRRVHIDKLVEEGRTLRHENHSYTHWAEIPKGPFDND